MPDGNDPGKVLRGGEFYSSVQGRLRTEDVLLSELQQPCSRKVPRHEHELAYVTVVLRGDYLEGERRLEELRPFTAVFNPAGIAHETVIGPAGAAFFTIELRDRQLRELGMRLPVHTLLDPGAGTLLWPGLRLYSAFKTQTLDPLLLEGHVMEMLGAIRELSSCGTPADESTAPRWFGRVKACLHEEFLSNIRIRDLADVAGVHPVHLARVFRKHEKQTPGDYLQRLRVRAACHQLRDPERPLVAVAMECGFADQSHFTRVFKKFSGTTPAEFRRRVAGA